ncbi:ADP-ribose 1''-phosphate phosphatase [Coniochaeta ligniaria NRRL 30616]|uniref:ADP-ribose 1''-phosphate phosphatase n=1 Tax=Coniochaeta ligniaria NRRL 30616 TaxID=1408157 RepID=A0A1J7J661_9PEZI|nr:ADP-ribose 1''-phosphate phosphatase [Coniochaeta ligniaria NRRL 30616]
MAGNFSGTFTLAEVATTIRQIPAGSFLVHSTNCLSIWGAGFAAEMSYMFPAAYERYRQFCNESRADPSDRWPPPSLVGKCLIIPPQDADIAMGAPSVRVVCLFTSYGYGRPNKTIGKPGMDRQSKILDQTVVALGEFRRQLAEMRANGEVKDVVIYSPHINSGAFRVPWDRTKGAVQSAFYGFDSTWNFMMPPGGS